MCVVIEMTPYPELLRWWTATITAGTMFLVLVSIYLYTRKDRNIISTFARSKVDFLRHFTFVWIMLALLALYIFSISNGSYEIFAAGNIVVEVILVIYVVRNRNV